MIRLILLAILVLGAMPALNARAEASGFDGITVIEFKEEAGWNAIRGIRSSGPARKGTYIVTFVSGRGTYATLLGWGNSRLCVAWAVEASYTGQSIAFGLPASVASMGASPDICQPFTLTLGKAGTVRIEAQNRFHDNGPVNEAAQTVNYGGSHNILARVPLVPLDWGQRIFDTHAVRGVRLGPLPAVEAALSGQPARISVSDLKRQMIFRKNFEAVVASRSGGHGATRVGGYVAAKEILGWPWDALYGVWLHERIAPTGLERFEGAATEQYGKASFRRPTDAGQLQLVWLYDLAGNQLTASNDEPDPKGERFIAEAAKPDNCLAVGVDGWLGKAGLPSIVNQDLGPWGCALIMIITYGRGGGAVDGYRIEMVSGYTLALNHFSTRLEELREMREAIERLQSRKPKL